MLRLGRMLGAFAIKLFRLQVFKSLLVSGVL